MFKRSCDIAQSIAGIIFRKISQPVECFVHMFVAHGLEARHDVTERRSSGIQLCQKMFGSVFRAFVAL